jgi:integrase
VSLYSSLNYQKPKSHYSSEDEIPVIIFYYHQGKKIKLSTGVTVRKGDWNPDLENPIKRSDSNYKFKNLQLKQKMVEVEKIIQNIELNGKIPETTLVKLYLKKILDEKVIDTKKEYDFFLLIKEYEVILKNDTRFTNGYRKHVVNCLIQISDYIREELNSSFYPISSLDEDFQKGYFNYSVTEKKRLNSTIQNHFKRLKSFVKWCYKSGYVTSPLETIPITTNFDKEIIYLKRDEILKLYNYRDFDFEDPNHDNYTTEYFTDTLKNGEVNTYTNWEVYKDMLVFGCGLGCRFSDLVNLKIDNYQFGEERNNGYFVFRMKKSRIGKQVRVPINQLTFNIWKKYSKNKTRYDFIFPRTPQGNSISNQKMNKHLKEIGRVIGLNRWVQNPTYTSDGKVKEGTDIREPLHKFLTSHIIRRTFIREGINNNIPYHVIMSMSGHSNDKVFQGYFSTIDEELDKTGKMMFSITNEVPKTEEKKVSVDSDLKTKLSQLKSLFEEGFITKDIYEMKVGELI